jgi:hypothetical protein
MDFLFLFGALAAGAAVAIGALKMPMLLDRALA